MVCEQKDGEQLEEDEIMEEVFEDEQEQGRSKVWRRAPRGHAVMRKKIPSEMEVATRCTLHSAYTVYTVHIVYTAYTLQTTLHCLNSSMYAYYIVREG